MIDWFGNEISLPEKPDKNTNPCIAVYGSGPDGKKCSECALLI